MIGLSSLDSSVTRFVVIDQDPQSTIRDAEARVSRYATLDGGVAVVHQGYSAGDRTLYVKGEISTEQETVLDDLFQTQSLVHIATPSGAFLGAITRLKTDNGELAMSLFLESQLSA